jgi:hypothetical protein
MSSQLDLNHKGFVMKQEHNCHHHACGCCGSFNRRDFMSAVGLSTLAAQSTLFSTTLTAGETAAPAARPRLRAVFMRPKENHVWGWPGMAFDLDQLQAEQTKTLKAAAEKNDIDLVLDAKPITDQAAVERLLAECKESPPDGIFLTIMQLNHDWQLANKFVSERGDIPTVLFAPVGTSFVPELDTARKAKKCFVASTKDFAWPAAGMKMLRAAWDMKTTRLCIIKDDKSEDRRIDTLGTTLHYIPLERWMEEYAKQETTAEVRALAEDFSRSARKIVEPSAEDVLNAAKNYFVAKRIMAAENCQGISLNCLPLVLKRRIPCPPCMAWQRLNDEGSIGCCECDWLAAISLLLCARLVDRPGFMQDPIAETINGTLIGAHCSSPTRLAGFDRPPAPQILRSHSESNIGVSPQVLWPLGEPVTIVWFENPSKLRIGTGRVVANIDTPPCGGCRTSVELKLDGDDAPRESKGFHQPFVLGRHDRLFRAYCELAGIESAPIV